MRLYHIYLLLMVTVIAFAAPFLVPIKDGRPLLDWRNIPMVAHTPSAVNLKPTATTELYQAPVKLYRWMDKNNRWQFSQNVPDDGTPYETIFVDPDKSLISSPIMDPSPATEPSPNATVNPETPISSSPYSPSEIAQLLQAARNTEALLRDRQSQQEVQLNGSHVER